MKRFRLYYDKDAELVWLNDMCRRGWAMESFFLGVYTFVPCQPGEYIYQIDMPEGSGFRPSDPEGYTEFMEDIGVEVVQFWGRWVILRKKAAEGPFEFYTDPASRIAQYRRIRLFFLWALLLELLCSTGVWRGALDGGAKTVISVMFLLIIAVFLRAIWRCTTRIRSLEKDSE